MPSISFSSVVTFVVLVVGVLYAIVLHEIAHGLVALWWGDTTAKDRRRLSLNPLVHIDPVGTVLVPVFMYLSTGRVFGWAKPVPINPNRFSHWMWGNLTVSLAGITANILVAVVLGVLFFFSRAEILLQLVLTNLFLAFFNLLPIPPLDGFRVVMSFLPREWQAKMEPYLFPLGFFFLVVFINTPIFSWLTNAVLGGAVSLLMGL